MYQSRVQSHRPDSDVDELPEHFVFHVIQSKGCLSQQTSHNRNGVLETAWTPFRMVMFAVQCHVSCRPLQLSRSHSSSLARHALVCHGGLLLYGVLSLQVCPTIDEFVWKSSESALVKQRSAKRTSSHRDTVPDINTNPLAGKRALASRTMIPYAFSKTIETRPVYRFLHMYKLLFDISQLRASTSYIDR
jgi:hypothetical protein